MNKQDKHISKDLAKSIHDEAEKRGIKLPDSESDDLHSGESHICRSNVPKYFLEIFGLDFCCWDSFRDFLGENGCRLIVRHLPIPKETPESKKDYVRVEAEFVDGLQGYLNIYIDEFDEEISRQFFQKIFNKIKLNQLLLLRN